MSDKNFQADPENLYRTYQQSRDNIPESVYTRIMNEAQKVRHEDNIHTILQQAKVHVQSGSHDQTRQHNNRATGFWQKLFTNSEPVWATVFASLALALIILPSLTNYQARYSNVAHLSSCANCDRYMGNALVSTRSISPGTQRIEPRLRIAAKLGQINTYLKLSVILNNQEILARADRELRKIANPTTTTNLNKTLSVGPLSAEALMNAIDQDIKTANSEDIFNAASEIHIANITARVALHESQDAAVQATLNRAVNAFAAIRQPTVLQQTVLHQLQELNTSDDLNEPTKLRKSIELLDRAMQSLGA